MVGISDEPSADRAAANAFPSGLATAIGSLPHLDPSAAAALVLRLIPELPAVPELPHLDARENMLARWLRALPEITVLEDGSLEVDSDADLEAAFDYTLEESSHAGLLAFIEVVAKQPRVPARVKAQLTGPLTLGVALTEVGVPAEMAFDRATRLSRGWARTIENLFRSHLPDTELLLFFDEPALALWDDDDPPIDHDKATDSLSGALAGVGCRTGIHVCGKADPRIALAAGPDVLGLEVSSRLLDDAPGLGRFLDGGGFIAWGAVPTDRPVGESASPLWKALVELWCELTRRGCDGLRLRSQAMITPACGLVGHGVSQAELALGLAHELSCRVFDQAVATKLTVGA